MKAPAFASALGTERFILEEKEVSDADITGALQKSKKGRKSRGCVAISANKA
ncbi:MAG: hypothetical protein ACFFFC_09555 [Candidatus Thorarchaeota archaeon]